MAALYTGLRGPLSDRIVQVGLVVVSSPQFELSISAGLLPLVEP